MIRAILTTLLLSTGVAFGQKANLDYIENQGQFPDQVNYKASTSYGSIYLEDHCFTFVVHNMEDLHHYHDHTIGHEEDEQHEEPEFIRSHAFKTHFLGSNEPTSIAQSDQRIGFYNYFIGNDPSKWASNVRRFGTVTQNNIYEGIDVRVYSQEKNMKYDFVVHPKADVSKIQLQHEGVDNVLLKDGNLVLQTSVYELIENKPYAYQVMKNGDVKEVSCEFTLKDGVVSFLFPEGYDEKRELIIDPVLVAATLSGSSSTNYGHSATYDIDGNIYTGARSFGTGYPTTTGAFQTAFGGGGTDIAISKLNPDGSNLIYATYLGGSLTDYPHSLVTNDNGEVWMLGSSASSDFPTSAGAYQTTMAGGQDHVLVHLSSDGSTMIGGTYFGGAGNDASNFLTNNYGDNYRGEIVIDDQDNCYVASSTESFDFPLSPNAYQNTIGGGQDAVFFSLNADMSTLNWSTYLGGAGEDAGFGLRVDDNGDIYTCGASTNFIPLTGYMAASQGATDAYIVKLSNDGSSLLNGTYWGTADDDNAFFIDLSGTGSVFIYGEAGVGMPVTPGIYTDAGSGQYIASFTNDLSTLNYSTLIGGSSIVPIAFMVDNCERIYFSGHSASSTGAPVTPDAIQTTGGFYVGVLEQGATGLYYGTYYGGNHVDGGTSRFDPSGIVYQGVCVASGFNTTPGAWASNQSGWDIGVFKIDFEVPNSSLNISVDDVVACGEPPFDVPFSSSAGANANNFWDFGDGNTSTLDNPTNQYQSTGTYNVTLISEDSTGCLASDTAYATIEIIEPEPFSASWNFTPPPPCSNVVTLDVDFTGSGTDSLVWILPDTTLLNVTDFQATYTVPGEYNVTLIAYDFDCSYTDTITQSFSVSEHVSLGNIVMPNVFTPNNDGLNEVYKPRYEINAAQDPFESLEYYHIVIVNRWGEKVFESGEFQTEWGWDGLANNTDLAEDGTYFYKAEYRQFCNSGDETLQEKHGFIHVFQAED
ncbi:MAG: hypothetical protein CSA03_04085 [Bacteroidetes bacterium]|nr:MAG: hypothetical protein CSA03_04085 [Bacteroidota bacterium]